MTNLQVKELWRYPIKGCAGESLRCAPITLRGIYLDRRWMIVDENGVFIAQRGQRGRSVGIRSLCKVQVRESGRCMVATAPQMPPLFVPLSTSRTETCDVQVWGWSGKAIEVSKACSDWFTEYANREQKGRYRLVQIADDEHRVAKVGVAELSFADGSPFLITSEESHADLNGRLTGEPVPTNRFRPNIVISGCDPYDEDKLDSLFSDGIVFKGGKLCDRCSVPSYDQSTGEIDSRPIAALAGYRRWHDDSGKPKVWFGRNYSHYGAGILHVGGKIVQI